MTNTQDEQKVFRRKNARRDQEAPTPEDPSVSAQQDIPATGAEIRPLYEAPTPVPTDNLPARLPEPWDRLKQVVPGVNQDNCGVLPLVNFHREAPASRAFDLLRSRLLQALRAKGWKRVGVVAPTLGCGSTFTAVNLALSMARVPDARIVLMDMNQRDPGVAAALDIHGHGNMRGFLAGERDLTGHLVRVGQTLALGLTDTPDLNAAELLHGSKASVALADMVALLEPDVVLYDLPAALSHNDFVACLPYLDGVLIVSDGSRTTAAQIAAVEDLMDDQAALLGVVLNRGRPEALSA